MMPAIYGNSYDITQGPGIVAIRYEMIHETRVIPLDGRPQPAKSITRYMGDARGRWEGNTLVVETTNFNATRRLSATPTRQAYTLIERFTPVGPDKVQWSVTIDDPQTWTRPWTFAMNLTKDDVAAALRVRVPRGELRAAQHPERRACGRDRLRKTRPSNARGGHHRPLCARRLA